MIFCKWTVHLWYDHHCTSFCWIFFGLWQTLIFCDTDALFEKQQKKKQNISGFMAESCTGFHCCISTCLPFLSLFIFWKSQSRLQLLFVLVEILILFDSRLIFKSQQSVHFAELSWCLQPFCLLYLQLNFPLEQNEKKGLRLMDFLFIPCLHVSHLSDEFLIS